MCYSHLVIRYHYPMVQYKCKKGYLRFKMSIAIKADILNDIEEQKLHVV
jgi:hypothetical protein